MLPLVIKSEAKDFITKLVVDAGDSTTGIGRLIIRERGPCH